LASAAALVISRPNSLQLMGASILFVDVICLDMLTNPTDPLAVDDTLDAWSLKDLLVFLMLTIIDDSGAACLI
jgi:hypothetical protein